MDTGLSDYDVGRFMFCFVFKMGAKQFTSKYFPCSESCSKDFTYVILSISHKQRNLWLSEVK